MTLPTRIDMKPYFTRTGDPILFNKIEHMDDELLEFLYNVRVQAGISFYITSAWRSAERNLLIGGHPQSLHPLGRAVDFATKGSRSGDNQLYYEDLWKITEAVVREASNTDCGVQLELVKGPTDKHLHLGLYPEEWNKNSKIVLAVD